MGEIRVTCKTDMIGQKYGRWTVISIAKIERHIYVNCLCDCGTKRIVNSESLLSGKSKSCGCLHRETIHKIRSPIKLSKHGEKLYPVWKTMRQRCTNPKNKSYPNYGGRGIKVCDEWQDYWIFYKWAISSGYREGLSIDRIDVNGNYCPENCRWLSAKDQNCNTRNNILVEYNGEKVPITYLSVQLGYNSDYIGWMIRHGNIFIGVKNGKIEWRKNECHKN